MLGLAPKEQLEKLVTAIEEGEATTIGTLLGELEAKGSSVSAVVGQLAQLLATKATLQPAIYQLIDALIEVPRAYNPHLKLLTTLMLFTQHNTVKPVAKKAVPVVALKPPAVEISRPTAELKKELQEKKLEAGEKVASRAETPDPVPTSTNTPLSDLTPEQWVTVLAAVKEKSVPLFGVLKQAQPLFDANTQTLTLKFKFQLHRKKLEDGKHKTLLATTLESTLGSIPVIQPIVDTKATPPVFSADPTVTSVAAIMGGGEMINAETI
jgi:DNA polymerase III gamma/tau subunit